MKFLWSLYFKHLRHSFQHATNVHCHGLARAESAQSHLEVQNGLHRYTDIHRLRPAAFAFASTRRFSRLIPISTERIPSFDLGSVFGKLLAPERSGTVKTSFFPETRPFIHLRVLPAKRAYCMVLVPEDLPDEASGV